MSTLILLLLALISGAFADDEVNLLISRKHAKEQRMKMILNETKEIRYNTFIFDLDDTGKEILGLLADAAQRGVKVQLILDDYHEGLVKKPHILQALKDMGVEVKIFNPLTRHPLNVNLRNHIKSLIGTDEMIVGGRNTQGHYFKEYIDIEAQINGAQVQKAKEHFDSVFNSPQVKPPVISKNAEEIAQAKSSIKEWAAKGRHHAMKPLAYRQSPKKVENLSYFADPPSITDKRAKGINKEIVAMIDRADETLEFINPYVLISPEEKAALQRAIKRGVKVKISTNAASATDSKLVAMAWELKKNELVQMGIELHESRQYVHAKTIIRDMHEVFIGSFNLDMRSHNLNLENGIFFKSRETAERLSTHHRRLVKTFMTKVEHKMEKEKNLLKGGAKCVHDGIRRLITEIVYPIL